MKSRGWKKAAFSTYNLWAGIRGDGFITKYPNHIRDLLRVLAKAREQGRRSRITVFFTKMDCAKGSIAEPCMHCDDKHHKRKQQLKAVAHTYDEIQWNLRAESGHAKFAAFDDGTVFVGGMNLTDSSWPDFMVQLQDKPLARKLLAWKG